MASIDKRPNGKYLARWREVPAGAQKTRQFVRKGDAERFLDIVRGDLARGVYVDPSAGKVTLRTYAEQWRSMQVHRPRTTAMVDVAFRCHVYPNFGERPISSLRPSDIQAWIASLSAELSPGTVRLAFRWLSAVLKAAVADRVLASNPCAGAKLPRLERKQVEPLATEQVTALADAVGDRYRALIVFAAGMGLRPSECFGLTVDRVDFLRRQVRVDRQLIGVDNGGPIFGPVKSQAGVRTIPLPTVVADELARHLAVFGAGPGGVVFTNKDGGVLNRSTFSNTWIKARAQAGLDSVVFKDLRHFYASLLIAWGCSVKAVQTRLGHESAMVTLGTYAHLWPDSDDETRNAVDEVLGDLAEYQLRTTGAG
jgi:integrase